MNHEQEYEIGEICCNYKNDLCVIVYKASSPIYSYMYDVRYFNKNRTLASVFPSCLKKYIQKKCPRYLQNETS